MEPSGSQEPTLPRTNLIVVRAGDRSLHPQWLACRERSWDLVVSYYGDRPERYVDQYDVLHLFKGTKWQGVSDFVRNHRDLIGCYRLVWLPDDDLLTSGENIDAFFALHERLGWVLSQPALTRYSHHSWPITLQDPRCIARRTDFVEIMAPCFRTDRLDRFLPTFDESASGWGLEWVWSRIVSTLPEDARMGIIDRTPVHHTRPVGAAGHGGVTSDPRLEMGATLRRHGLRATPPRVLARLEHVHEESRRA